MNTKTFRRKAKQPELAAIPREAAPDINDNTFTLLRRIVTLTDNGSRECSYTSAQVFEELGIKPHNTRDYMRALRTQGYIATHRGHRTGFTAGRIVRVITLLRTFDMEAGHDELR